MTARRTTSRFAAALAAVVGFVVLLASPAFADTIAIRSVDTTDFPEVRIEALVTGQRPDLGTFTLRENDKILQGFDVVPLAETTIDVGIVLAIDVSGSMNDQGALDQAKAAAKQFVANRLANDRIAIVAFGTSARVAANFTQDAGLLNGIIDGLLAQGETALYDGVRQAAALFDGQPADLQRNIVVLTDGRDTASTTRQDEAQAAAVDAKATVFTVGMQTGDFDPGPMEALASRTGGQFLTANDPAALAGVYGQVQATLQNQYEIRYTSQSESPTIEVAVAARGLEVARASTSVGGRSVGANAQPEVVDSAVPGVLSGPLAKWLGLGLAIVAAALLSFGVILIFVRERGGLEAQLAAYTSGASGEDEEGKGVFNVAALRQAIDVTSRFAERQGVLPKVESMLEQGDVPLRAGEALFFYGAVVLVGTALWLVVTRSLFGTLVGLLLLVLAPPAVLNFLAGARKRKFLSQLPDTLQLLSGSLRAGYSLMQGVETVSQEIDDPMGRELRRIVAESRLGRPLEEALDDSAERMESPDFSWAVMAIKIQREVGGNLAELLETVAETMIARERLRREVKALTAEGRISAIILGLLPVGMLAVLYGLNREYISLLFEETMGRVMLLTGALLAAAGFFWLKKIVEVEI